MAVTYKHLRSDTAGKLPQPSQIEEGQLFINTADKVIATKRPDGSVITFDKAQELTNLTNYSETESFRQFSGPFTINLSEGLVQLVRLLGDSTITLPNPPDSGESKSFVIILYLNGHALTWEESNIDWITPEKTVPELATDDKANLLTFISHGFRGVHAERKWLGNLAGKM